MTSSDEMIERTIARLADRSAITVTGADARTFLANLITNNTDGLKAVGDSIHAGLLTPQGKIISDFFVIQTDDGFLLDVPASEHESLIKRLSMYRLRSDVALSDASQLFAVFALWGPNASETASQAPGLSFQDPRHPNLGLRLLASPTWTPGDAISTRPDMTDTDSFAAYEAHRIALGVPDGGSDYAYGNTFPHEALWDQTRSIDFTKGCFIGQEVISRMQHRGTARKRIVHLTANARLAPAAEVKAGTATIGTVGSSDGTTGLALMRLDRVAEARSAGVELTVNGQPITIAVQPWLAFSLDDFARDKS